MGQTIEDLDLPDGTLADFQIGLAIKVMKCEDLKRLLAVWAIVDPTLADRFEEAVKDD